MNSVNDIAYHFPQLPVISSIVIIGAGSIVQTAHLPAYRLAKFSVAGIFDPDHEKAMKVAHDFQIPMVYNSIKELVSQEGTGVIYDVAVPASAMIGVLEQLPDYAFVLMQKPMGENEQQAQHILDLCTQKRITAGVNLQLRYAPYIIMAKQMIAAGWLGDICDVEIYVNVYTPWQLWNFLFSAPRVEILYHSIHYIDLVRNLLGNPLGVYAKTTGHPGMDALHSVRSNIIMDYGDMIRANILTNHAHGFGLKNQDAYIKIEGTKGAIKIRMGLLMNYPEGVPDQFEYVILNDSPSIKWEVLPVNGSWFPHAFIGSMAEIMKAKTDHTYKPDNSVEDCIYTMRCVEAAYSSGKS